VELRPEELHQGVLRRARREPNLQAVDAAAQLAALPVPTTDRLLADGAKWGLVRGAVARSLLPRFGGTQSTVASSADIVSVAPHANRGPTQDECPAHRACSARAPLIGSAVSDDSAAALMQSCRYYSDGALRGRSEANNRSDGGTRWQSTSS